jgi:two-component system LytT family response regulator
MGFAIKILIVEDEESSVKRLIKELKNLAVEFEVQAVLNSVQSVLEWVQAGYEADLVFMDIHITDGLSFEIFKHTNLSIPVIFTTAYDEYALQAFKVKGLDYLLKPIDPLELEKAINHFLASYKDLGRQNLMHQLISIAKDYKTNSYRSSFLVDFKQKMHLVDVSDVAYFYVKERGLFLRKKDQKEYVIEFFLDELEKQLDPTLFYRANRQYIVARSVIEEIEPYFTGRLLLKVNPEPASPILISKEKASDFKRWADY